MTLKSFWIQSTKAHHDFPNKYCNLQTNFTYFWDKRQHKTAFFPLSKVFRTRFEGVLLQSNWLKIRRARENSIVVLLLCFSFFLLLKRNTNDNQIKLTCIIKKNYGSFRMLLPYTLYLGFYSSILCKGCLSPLSVSLFSRRTVRISYCLLFADVYEVEITKDCIWIVMFWF